MGRFVKGDVVVIPFPFSDLSATKRRPALVTTALPGDDVILRHTAPEYRVYLLGFAPGFAYLGDLDPSLVLPRRSSPRTRVPAGSVAIGGEHTGIYTTDSPGGWNIIGHTPLRIFDPDRSDEGMFWLKSGDRVKFVPVA